MPLVAASLSTAPLNAASLNGASLNGASLNGASLNGASLDGVRGGLLARGRGGVRGGGEQALPLLLLLAPRGQRVLLDPVAGALEIVRIDGTGHRTRDADHGGADHGARHPEVGGGHRGGDGGEGAPEDLWHAQLELPLLAGHPPDQSPLVMRTVKSFLVNRRERVSRCSCDLRDRHPRNSCPDDSAYPPSTSPRPWRRPRRPLCLSP
ncbi:pentapeptide repeat-containing protein [Nonomuraea sp. NPDC049646]|uniref:pentapeptide repeat-containing protein n=1 Tax=unclassified Nonomuraea TaxID=2593643 RepID=UPI00378833DC